MGIGAGAGTGVGEWRVGLPTPPSGYAYVLDNGAYVVDNGSYVIEEL